MYARTTQTTTTGANNGLLANSLLTTGRNAATNRQGTALTAVAHRTGVPHNRRTNASPGATVTLNCIPVTCAAAAAHGLPAVFCVTPTDAAVVLIN